MYKSRDGKTIAVSHSVQATMMCWHRSAIVIIPVVFGSDTYSGIAANTATTVTANVPIGVIVMVAGLNVVNKLIYRYKMIQHIKIETNQKS